MVFIVQELFCIFHIFGIAGYKTLFYFIRVRLMVSYVLMLQHGCSLLKVYLFGVSVCFS